MKSEKENALESDRYLDYFPEEAFLINQTIKMFQFSNDFQQLHEECAIFIIAKLCESIQNKGLHTLMTNVRILSPSRFIACAINIAALMINSTAYSQALIPIKDRGLMGLFSKPISAKNDQFQPHHQSAVLSPISDELYKNYFLILTGTKFNETAAEAYLHYINITRKNAHSKPDNIANLIANELIALQIYEETVSKRDKNPLPSHNIAIQELSLLKNNRFSESALDTIQRMFTTEEVPFGL